MTREHYEKYARLSDCIPTETVRSLYEDHREGNLAFLNHINLQYLYHRDDNLNSIPLKRFDEKFGIIRRLVHKAHLTPHGGLSLAESVCILKHILIFRVLEKEVPLC